MKSIKIIVVSIAVLFFAASCTKQNEENQKHEVVQKQKEYWTCSMHPQIHEDHPGSCPICGMDLIKKVEEEKPTQSVSKEMSDMLSLSGIKQLLANVSTVKVAEENLDEEVKVYSYLDFAENNRKVISAYFSGRIEKLFVDKTGDYIKKGDPLFEIYSPELVQAQNDYLIAMSKKDMNASLVAAARKKLEILGLIPEQIHQLEKTQEVKITTTFYSPVSGTVIEKKIQEGMYVNEGTQVYDVADLSSLWNIAEVYESDLHAVKVGSEVKLKVKAFPGEEFKGRVSLIYPVVNAQARTVKVRSLIANATGKLKPQMYGETVFSNHLGKNLVVPVDAVIIAGERSVVWVKTSDGMFEAHKVKVGVRVGEKYQILSGLNVGDEVAATGGFLIDSESQLKTDNGSGHNH